MKVKFYSSKQLIDYINNLENENERFAKIFSALEEYIKQFGKSYPNGRQFFTPYKCVDNLRHILYDIDDYIKVNDLGGVNLDRI